MMRSGLLIGALAWALVMLGGCGKAIDPVVDPCEPNPCNAPPADDCAGDVANTFSAEGACSDDHGSAACDYAQVAQDCAASQQVCAAGTCVECNNDSDCNDGIVCNGVETCSAVHGCVAGVAVACPNADGLACTVEACSEAVAGCETTLNHAACPAGELCVANLGGCSPAPACSSDAECDDGDDCNGLETCAAQGVGQCQPGTPVVCDDGIACTIDVCIPADGTCTFASSDSLCDDALACNGAETCAPLAAGADAASGCLAGTGIVCKDAIDCTVDLCVEPSGSCDFSTLDDSACPNTDFCSGAELCDPSNVNANAATGCVASGVAVCDDGIPCTQDSCDAVARACSHVPDDSQCACGQSCDLTQGCGDGCLVATCSGKVMACGDCVDNDGDCRVDSADESCLGPCDNNEEGFHLALPGAGSSCQTDCYFDGDSGAGNDDCYWTHACDPLEVAPDYDPAGPACGYDANANMSGSAMTCAEALSSQSAICLDSCGPLTPNGCDCFGCCLPPGAPFPIWLGSANASSGTPGCTIDTLADPSECRPCTIVQACFNSCENCELCLGKPTLPPECGCQQCPAGAVPCGAPCGGACPASSYCVSGCCVALPQ